MTAQEYANMYKAVPTRHGLAAVARAFILEADDRAKKLQTREEIEQMAEVMVVKWVAFCALVSDLELKPEVGAMAGLKAKLLHARGFDS